MSIKHIKNRIIQLINVFLKSTLKHLFMEKNIKIIHANKIKTLTSLSLIIYLFKGNLCIKKIIYYK